MLRIALLGVALLAVIATVNAACEDDQVMHCSSCSNPGVECIQCPWGWLLNEAKTACDRCPDNCYECERISGDNLRCLECNGGFALRDSDTVCLQCSTGCRECHHTTGDATECDDCMMEYAMTSVKTCISCPSNCAVCDEGADGSAVCTECYESYFLKSDKTCKKCPTNCIQCNDNGEGVGSCTKCRDNYLVNQDTPTGPCLSCPLSCSSCIGEAKSGTTAKCSDCEDAFALDNDECVSCDANCIDCETATSCNECEEGYRVDSGSCVGCPEHCLECELEDNVEKCSECDDSWVPKDEVTCDACGNNCLTCTSSGFCTLCADGYSNDNNGVCQKCPSHCIDCTYSTSKKKTTCRPNWCESGYTDDPDGECKSCPTKCQENRCDWSNSEDDTVCSACFGNSDDGYYTLNDDKTRCLECPDNCIACSYNATGAGRVVCDTCATYHELKDEECPACPDNCKACTYNSTADAMDCDSENDCDSGFRLDDDAGGAGNDICTACAVENCHRCNATDSCLNCNSPYLKKTDGSECRACPDHCTSCKWNGDESESLCISDAFCDSEYGLSTDDKCPPCRSHCLTCPQKSDGSNPCKSGQCESEYTDDDDGDCKGCPGKCHECSWSSSDGRAKCDSGRCYSRYALITTGGSEGNCASCPENCAICDWRDDANGGESRTWCTECDARYDLRDTDGTCVACPDHCNKCTYVADSDETDCDSNEDCDSCYGIDDERNCIDCPDNCEDCTRNTDTGVMQCDDCKTRFVANEGVCGACPKNCKTCSHSAGNVACSECNDRYALADGECLSCPKNCYECTAVNGATRCKENQCFPGYGLNSGKTCSTCSSMFENCARCSDTTGKDAAGADMTDCEECFGAYTLADDRRSCKDTFSGTCMKYEDRDYVCSSGSCDEGYVEMRNGSCSSQCYSCGSTMNAVFLDKQTCDIDSESAGNATTELCLSDCWVMAEKTVDVDEDYRIARGCGIPAEDMLLLTGGSSSVIKCEDFEGTECREVQRNGVTVKRCWKCCQGDKCNDFDGGSTAIQACAALLLAAVLALHL